MLGATGAQGGGLVRAILADKGGGFRVRAITRDVYSAKARTLAALGAEVVAADVNDQASLEKAFEGAFGAFCVTFYWAHLSPDTERANAQAMAAAAKAAGVGHVIWSTLEDTRKFVPHDLGLPVTMLLTTFFWDNLLAGAGPMKGPDGKLVFTLPMANKKLAGIAAEQTAAGAWWREAGLWNNISSPASPSLSGVPHVAFPSRPRRGCLFACHTLARRPDAGRHARREARAPGHPQRDDRGRERHPCARTCGHHY